ncbi:MAG: methyltransferase [Solirubrobacterales bacterium]|jgi:SAM-dependent methyltransferase|nr:methyltransferase [Solirubrobacterales bacterium]
MTDHATDDRVARPADMPCRLCGSAAQLAFVAYDRNRALSTERFAYTRCPACECIALGEVPRDLARYYPAGAYGTAEEASTPELVERERAKLELVRRYAPGREIVELGPGPGLFTRFASDNGFEVTAIEMDENYCRELNAIPGVTAICSNDPANVLSTLTPSAAIVLWHVIEHLADPWQVLKRCVESLVPGGVLAVSTPNPDSLQFRLLRSRWVHLDAPRHLQLIPARALERELLQAGMVRVLTVADDPVGRELNRMGWEYALRRNPPGDGPTPIRWRGSILMARLMAGVERRDLAGASYTSLFTRGS